MKIINFIKAVPCLNILNIKALTNLTISKIFTNIISSF